MALFEGLHILSQALNGEFSSGGPGHEPVSVPKPGDIVVETILYLNAARRTFLELVQAALLDSAILEEFRISAPSPGAYWHVKTPEGCSGDTAWWQQLLIIPRVAGGADVAGNMKSPGRRVVGQSRGTFGNTNYFAAECFEAKGERAPMLAWKSQCLLLASDSCPYSRAEVSKWVSGDLDSPNDMVSFPGTKAERMRVLEMLCRQVPLEAAVKQSLQAGDDGRGNALPDAISALLCRLAEEASGGQPKDSLPMSCRHLGDTSDDIPGTTPTPQWACPQDARRALGLNVEPDALSALKMQMVPWPTISIKNGFVHICILVLDASVLPHGGPPQQIVERVIHAGRLLALLLWYRLPDDLKGARAMLVPHKLKRVTVNNQSITLRQCWSERQALVLVPETSLVAASAILYTYIGGGVDHQPPNTYPLVFRSMPFSVGASLAAQAAEVMGIDIEMSMIYCRDAKRSQAERTSEEERFLKLVHEKRQHWHR